MEDIFKDAYFGKAYKTRDGRKAIFIAQSLSNAKLITQHKFGFEEFRCNELGSHINLMEEPQSILDIVGVWQEPIDKEEYEEKIKSLISSCSYWEAYEDEPALFAKAFKELLDFAPEDERTVDYCAYLIKSKKTILNEIYSNIKINEEELDRLAEEYATRIDDEYMAKHPETNWDDKFVEYHWQDIFEAYKAGCRKE